MEAGAALMIEGKYRYIWKNTTRRKKLCGRSCVIVVPENGPFAHRSTRVKVRFDNGEEMSVSKAALRRIDG